MCVCVEYIKLASGYHLDEIRNDEGLYSKIIKMDFANAVGKGKIENLFPKILDLGGLGGETKREKSFQILLIIQRFLPCFSVESKKIYF